MGDDNGAYDGKRGVYGEKRGGDAGICQIVCNRAGKYDRHGEHGHKQPRLYMAFVCPYGKRVNTKQYAEKTVNQGYSRILYKNQKGKGGEVKYYKNENVFRLVPYKRQIVKRDCNKPRKKGIPAPESRGYNYGKHHVKAYKGQKFIN
jgi:hypothetical protein